MDGSADIAIEAVGRSRVFPENSVETVAICHGGSGVSLTAPAEPGGSN